MGETNKDVWAGDGAGASGTGDGVLGHEGAVDRMEKRAEGKSGVAWQGRRLFRRKEVGMRKGRTAVAAQERALGLCRRSHLSVGCGRRLGMTPGTSAAFSVPSAQGRL